MKIANTILLLALLLISGSSLFAENGTGAEELDILNQAFGEGHANGYHHGHSVGIMGNMSHVPRLQDILLKNKKSIKSWITDSLLKLSESMNAEVEVAWSTGYIEGYKKGWNAGNTEYKSLLAEYQLYQ